MRIKKTKKAKKQRGNTTHGWGARKKHKGSGHRGGFGMAGTGKRADHKKTWINKKYGNKYFGKQGITSKKTEKKRVKFINVGDIEKKFNSGEINLSKYRILGNGEISKKFIIKAKAFTKGAKEKIEKAGGEIILPIKKENPKKEKIEDKKIIEK